jgi:hypothetical protein
MPPCNVNMLLEFTDTYSILWGFQDLDSICNCQNLDTELFSWEFIARVWDICIVFLFYSSYYGQFFASMGN